MFLYVRPGHLGYMQNNVISCHFGRHRCALVQVDGFLGSKGMANCWSCHGVFVQQSQKKNVCSADKVSELSKCRLVCFELRLNIEFSVEI